MLYYLKDVENVVYSGCYQRCLVLSDRNLAELGWSQAQIQKCVIFLQDFPCFISRQMNDKTQEIENNAFFPLRHISLHGFFDAVY